MTIAGAVIAGGESRRMGVDKARLQHPTSGHPLWRHQLDRLRSLDLDEYLLSVRQGQGLGETGPEACRAVPDRHPGAGPLGGLATVLSETRCDCVLVLAVDSVDAGPEILLPLLESCRRRSRGAVYRSGNRFEPLIAVYPARAAALAEEMLAAGRLRLQDFVSRAAGAGWLDLLSLPAGGEKACANFNTVEEWRARFGGVPGI